MSNVKNMDHHFERVAPVYGEVRNTDPHIIKAIIPRLPSDNPPVSVVDIGCGTGRYSSLMADHLGSNLQFYCSDYAEAMLAECRKRISRELPSMHVLYCRASANDLPFAGDCFDGVVTFNAIHHFRLNRFIAEAARIVRLGGLLSIYTRTPGQNARNIWGQHFPDFTQRETRLYRGLQLEEAIGSASGLELEDIQTFKHVRVDTPESLLDRARSFHYSTLAFYSPHEFMRALTIFEERLSSLSDNGIIEHTAENMLVLARRT